jgi:hypothetical protein
MTTDELGTALSSVGPDLAWPEPDDLSGRVLARVQAGPPRIVRLPLSRRTRIALIAAAVTLLLAGAAVAAKLVIDLGAVVVRVPEGTGELPSPSPPSFGTPMSLDEAEDLLGSAVTYPSELGEPDRVWADRVITEAGAAVRVSMAWAPTTELPAIEGSRFGAVLMRFEGSLEIASKDVYQDTGTLEPARVDDTEAFWATGPHLLKLLTGDGVVYVRVDGNVLLWREGTQTLRLETSLSKREAERLATSIPSISGTG